MNEKTGYVICSKPSYISLDCPRCDEHIEIDGKCYEATVEYVDTINGYLEEERMRNEDIVLKLRRDT